MKRRPAILAAAIGLSCLAFGQTGAPAASPAPELRVMCQVSGPFNVRSYLVYDAAAKEAALIDAGSAVDQLLAAVGSQRLRLKFVFLTHAHQDHVAGLPAVKAGFPEARLCFSRREFEDAKEYRAWRTLFNAKSVAQWEKDPAIAALMDLDYRKIPAPDVDPRDGQTFRVGGLTIKALLTPGHSRGSATFAAANLLFPGDLILYHGTGQIDYPLCSKDDIAASIRRLYDAFPDETVLNSGHGDASTIGYEKLHNKTVTAASRVPAASPRHMGKQISR